MEDEKMIGEVIYLTSGDKVELAVGEKLTLGADNPKDDQSLYLKRITGEKIYFKDIFGTISLKDCVVLH